VSKSKIPLPLFKNEIIKGHVIKALTSQKALLFIKGRTVLAQCNAPLKDGAVVSLKVVNTEPAPTLQFHGEVRPNSTGPNMRHVLSAVEENVWKSVMEKAAEPGFPSSECRLTKTVLKELSRDLWLKPQPDSVRKLIDKSGLRWEAKLKNLLLAEQSEKGRVKKLITLVKQIEDGGVEKLIKGDLKGLSSRSILLTQEEDGVLHRFVTALDHIQLLNRQGLDQKQKIFLPVPMHFQDGFFTVGQLFIHLPQEESHQKAHAQVEKPSFSVTFLLQMSSLGPLRADLALNGKTINGKIWLTREDAKELMEKNLPSLVNNLTRHGFLIQRLECQIRDKEEVGQSLFKEMLVEQGHSISLRA